MSERIIRRQPEKLQIIPSKPNPWYGSIVEGDPLTIEQRRALDAMTAGEGVELMTVYRQATSREMWWGTNSPPPVYEFQCPIIGRRKGGAKGVDKVKIIAPNGDTKLVFPDGWVLRPHRLNRGYIDERHGFRRTRKGLRYSAWDGNRKPGHVTYDGAIVQDDVTAWASGRIAMMRDQAEIATEHGWIIDETIDAGDSFDVVVERV